MARYGDLDSQYFDDAGDPLISGKIYFYETGTTTLKTTYSDVNLTIPNTNPVILTAAGRQPNIFFDGVAKAILTTSANVQILVRDPVGQTTSSFGDAWVSSKIYGANDVVQGSDGEFYVSLAANNVNNNPASTSGFWVLLYSVEWNAGITYTEGAVVTVNNLLYQSLQNSNLNQNPVTQTAYWRLISLAYVSTITYTVGQNVVGPDGVFYTALRTTVGDTPASSPSDWVGTSAAAAASATAALASQVAAAASASTATTQAGLASTSAGTATTQAGIATTQAGIATTQAGNASTSASAASSSAASAAASYDSFDDRYLGPKSSDPTLDNDGNPLLTGALYFNTVSNEMRVYSGAAWLIAYLPAAGYATAGANSNITSLSGLTTPLSPAQGGTGITSFGSGVATFLGTPSSANLIAAVTDETGTGSLVFATSPTLTTPVLGTPTSGNLSNCTVDGTDAVGFRNIPINSNSAAYTTVLADSGKIIFHPSTDANARTFTIDSNANVAYPLGTALTFINMTSQVVTIAITSDTMYLSSAGTTGSRSLAQYGSATAIKMTSTTWLISGSGLT